MINLENLPHPADQRIAIHVKPAAERALRAGHPWLFDESIRKISHYGEIGDLAVIFDSNRQFLAIGLYDPISPIRVKVLQHLKSATINQAFFAERLTQAVARRASLAETDTNGYRLVHGENDGLPGLIIDRYADTLVLKLYTVAWLPHLRDILTALPDIQPHTRLVLRLSRSVAEYFDNYALTDGQVLHGDPITEPIIFQENGLSFAADVIAGHKTGFFFDQRDNRAKVRSLAENKHVLDVFSYNGGFSLYSAAGGALSVTSLDVSAPALASAQENFALNLSSENVRAAEHKIIVEDAFAGLKQLAADGHQFSLVVVDPPSFAKNAAEINGALLAYERLTRLALDLVMPKGSLVMASCSSRVTPNQFFNTVKQTARMSGRRLKNVETTSHALDHPIGFPEGEYLKCLFATV